MLWFVTKYLKHYLHSHLGLEFLGLYRKQKLREKQRNESNAKALRHKEMAC